MTDQNTPVLRESATFDRLTIQEIQRAAETGIYDIRAVAVPSASCRTSTTCCCWAPASRATRWKATARSAVPMWYSAPASPRSRFT
ncbi:hypothetical protein Q3H58_000629 [Pseudomonas psychrotolerans]|nr:hypothetical protein [Pseudomonas psychrotolerans]